MRFGTGPGDGYHSRSSRGHYKGLELARKRVAKAERKVLRRGKVQAVWVGIGVGAVIGFVLIWTGVIL